MDITLLNDPECENYVLGTIITRANTLEEVADILTEDCFYDTLHRNIYQAIIAISAKGDAPDIIAVRSWLTANKVSFRLEYLMQLGVTYNLRQYACRLHELYVRRQFFELSAFLQQHSQSEERDIADVVAYTNDRLAGLFNVGGNAIATVYDGIRNVHEIINRNLTGTTLTGTPTGFEELDSKIGGLQKSDLVIIAGETSQGKTSLAVSIMNHAASQGAQVAMYSMEMKKEQICARLLSIESGVSSKDILYRPLNEYQLQQIDKGIGKIANRPIYFDDRSTSGIDSIISSIRYMKLKHGIDGAIVDYLQILNVNMKGTNKEQQMGEVARRLKNLAKELDIWIIALSQLNRDSSSPVPTLARLRDSGQIAEAADIVMLVYRPETKGLDYPAEFKSVSTQNTALIDIAKGRNVGLMKFICGFEPTTTRFYSLSDTPFKHLQQDDEEQPF